MARGANKPGVARGKGSASRTISASSKDEPRRQIPLELQQKCLNIFRDALDPSTEDSTTLQQVKGHLFKRDFNAAFGEPEYLRVYASRWSPSRALGYLEVFDNLSESLELHPAMTKDGDASGVHNVISVGGGAGAELVALTSWLSAVLSTPSSTPISQLNITLVDIADWKEVMSKLEASIITPPELSKYASQAKKDANRAMLQPVSLSIKFDQQDILGMNGSLIKELLQDADLVTFMFTMNELFTESMPKTQQLLSYITEAARPGLCLLIIDSPGSYSTVSLNGKEKRYPMEWLIDHKLRGPVSERENPENTSPWERLVSDDSRWFRLPEKLEYPIELENMRYQIHLYRRISAT